MRCLNCCLIVWIIWVEWWVSIWIVFRERWMCVYISCHSNIWQNLLNWQWPLPQHSDTAPEAPFIHADESKSFESHGIWIIINISIHELVGWNPFGIGACVLPHIKVMLCFLSGSFISILLPCCVHVAAIKEGAAAWAPCQCLSGIWTVDIGFGEWIGVHELWCFHVESRGNWLA